VFFLRVLFLFAKDVHMAFSLDMHVSYACDAQRLYFSSGIKCVCQLVRGSLLTIFDLFVRLDDTTSFVTPIFRHAPPAPYMD